MNSTFKLASFLGSPFVDEEKSGKFVFTSKEKVELYQLAYKNKIGLFFLQRLKNIGELNHQLEDNYAEDMDRFTETTKTAVSLSSKLKNITSDFAIFKFLKPYPHTPSDVDVLFFLPKEEYFEVVDCLLNDGYHKIGECPSQVVVYDLRGGVEQMDTRVVEGKKGGRYYIDLYNDVSVSHFIYINKGDLSDYVVEIDSLEGKIQTLDPVAELPVVLTHSIIPEQLFTLADYYVALYYMNKMKKTDLKKMASIFKNNDVTRAGFSSLGMVSSLHKKLYGFSPEKINYLVEEVGWDSKTPEISDDFSLPYRHDVSTLVSIMAERVTNSVGAKSMAKQALFMANPRLMKWVIFNLIFRRKRETY